MQARKINGLMDMVAWGMYCEDLMAMMQWQHWFFVKSL